MTRFGVWVLAGLLAISAIGAGCGDDDASDGDDPSPTASTVSGEGPTRDFDFEATAAAFVDALAAGDCDTAADLQLVKADDPGREFSVEGCRKATEELAAFGEVVDKSTRRQDNDDGSVFVWVTWDFRIDVRWELVATFRERPGEGWAIGSYAYGTSDSAD